MEINIKEIIKPKFAIGQTVYVRRDGKSHVTKGEIASWHMNMKADDKGVQEPEFHFYIYGIHGASFREGSIFTSAAAAFGE